MSVLLVLTVPLIYFTEGKLSISAVIYKENTDLSQHGAHMQITAVRNAPIRMPRTNKAIATPTGIPDSTPFSHCQSLLAPVSPEGFYS